MIDTKQHPREVENSEKPAKKADHDACDAATMGVNFTTDIVGWWSAPVVYIFA